VNAYKFLPGNINWKISALKEAPHMSVSAVSKE